MHVVCNRRDDRRIDAFFAALVDAIVLRRSSMNRLTTLLFAVATLVSGCGGGGSKVDAACVGGTNCGEACEVANEKGVGRYCTAGGGECNQNDAPFIFCTVDYEADAPGFCTGPCSKDEDCGTNAYCSGSGMGGRGCQTAVCGGMPVDAGVAP